MLALAAACGDARADGVVELEFWAMGREGEVVEALVRDFEREHPGIRVSVQQIPWTAAHEKMLTAYVGDATPDVAQLGNTWVPEFVALDALAPLGPWVARSEVIDPADYFRGIWLTNVVDSTLYGIPWYVDTRVVFYRTDVLRAAGYDAFPRTWAGWREAMERIRADVGPGRYAIFLPTNEWAQPAIFGLQAGSPLLKEGGRFGAFADPRFRRAFAFYDSLFADSLAPPLGNQQMANLYQEFERGTFAMYITGPWNVAEFRARLSPAMQGKWTTAPLPGPDGPGVSSAGGASLVMFRRTPHEAEAWRLIEYLSRPEQQRRFARLSGALPPRLSAWEDSTLRGDREMRAFWEQLQRTEPLPKVPEIELIVQKLAEHAEGALRSDAPIDRTLGRLDREVDAILEKRRWMLEQARGGRDAGGGGR